MDWNENRPGRRRKHPLLNLCFSSVCKFDSDLIIRMINEIIGRSRNFWKERSLLWLLLLCAYSWRGGGGVQPLQPLKWQKNIFYSKTFRPNGLGFQRTPLLPKWKYCIFIFFFCQYTNFYQVRNVIKGSALPFAPLENLLPLFRDTSTHGSQEVAPVTPTSNLLIAILARYQS